ncbi:MAG: MFS transporter [Legionellales bacterium]|nr:MFS transporter [Legionellales bacterium]
MLDVEEYQGLSVKYVSLMPWVVCVSASLFFFYEFIQGNMFASIADNIMHDFHIEADKMTYLSSVYYLSNVIFLFAAGLLLDRFSPKKTMLFAMMLCVFSTFVLAYAHSFYVALGCRFVTGIGSAFCFLGPIRIASRWFPPKRMALVTGAIVTMAMSGGLLAQYPLTKLVVYVGWRDALVMVAWLGVLMLVVMAFGIKDKPQQSKIHLAHKIHRRDVIKIFFHNAQTLRSAFYTSLMNMAVAVFGAMMGSLYLMQRLSVGKEDASLVNSMLFLGVIIGGPFMGWCSDRLGLRVLPMKVGALVSLFIVLIILYAPVSLGLMGLLFFLLGFFTASQVISYALVVESNSPAVTAMAVSMISVLTQGGYIVYQNVFSRLLLWHGEMHMEQGVPVYSMGDYQTAVMILPIGLSLALLAIWKLKETYCRPILE